MPSPTLAIADLLDYEAQQAQDALLPVQELVRRDRAIGQKAPAQSDGRALLSFWLAEMRSQNPRLPGKAWVQTHRFTTFACIVLGLMSGSGLMRSLLAYDGTRPVSVFPILGFFVFLQVFFLVALALRSTAHSFLRRGGVGFFPDLVLRWLRVNLKDVFRRESDAVRASREFFQRFHALHAPLEFSVAMEFFQTFVLAFHVGALATFLSTIAFSDLTFSWGTTPRLSPEVFHNIVRVVSLPFAWIPTIVPNLEFIEATQYSRLDERYVLAPAGSRLPLGVDVGAWWPFLTACIATYAVFPRLCIVFWEKHVIRRYLRRRAFDDHASGALLTRLREPAGVWATLETASKIPGARGDQASFKTDLTAQNTARCVVLKWFGFPAEETALKTYLEHTFRVDVAAILESSGTVADMERVREALIHATTKGGGARLVIASDPWEVPGEAAERMLEALRSPPLTHLVCLFAPLVVENGQVRLGDEKDVEIWRQSLRLYRDPYAGLIVDLGEAP